MKRGKNRPSPLRLLTDGVLLLMALAGAAFSFSTAFGLDVDNSALLIGLAVLALLSLALYTLPRRRGALLLGLSAAYGGAVWLLWDVLSAGEVITRCAVVNLYAQHLSFVQGIYPLAEHTPEQWRTSATCFLLAVAAPLSVLLGWGVARRRSFWLPFWLTLPFAGASVAVTQTPGWLPLMVLMCCWCVLLLRSLAARRDPEGGARLTLLALPAVAVLLALLTLAFPRADYTHPRWAAAAQTGIMNWMNRSLDGLTLDGPLPGIFGSGFAAAGGTQDVNLSAAGPLNFSGRTVLKVTSQVKGKMYLRGYSNGLYEDNAWRQLPEDTYVPPLSASSIPSPGIPEGAQEGASIVLTVDGGDALLGIQPMNFPSMTAPGSPFYPVVVENIGAPAGCVYVPYQLLTTPDQLAGARFERDADLARARNVRTHTRYDKPGALLEEGAQFTPLEGIAARAERAYREFVYANYLDVPEGFGTSIQPFMSDLWARTAAGEFDAFQRENDALWQRYQDLGLSNSAVVSLGTADQVAYLLSAMAEYDPDTPLTPEGEDFTVHFMCDSRRGYCMHFASAATLLLRYLGIPARYVTGYVTYFAIPGTVNVPDYAAHAWTEIYLDGYGWYPVDATPGYLGGAVPWSEESQTQATPTPSAAPTPTPTPSAAPSPTPTPSPSAAPTPEAEGGPGGFSLPAWLLVPACLLLAILALWARRRVCRALRRRRFRGEDANGAVIAAYRYLKRLEPWGGEITPAYLALAQKARFSPHTLSAEERDAMAEEAQNQAERADVLLSAPRRFAFRWIWALH